MASVHDRPRRVRLSRAKGWRLTEQSTNVVVVDRRTRYGNPFVIRRDRLFSRPWVVLYRDQQPPHSIHPDLASARASAVALFARWIRAEVDDPADWVGSMGFGIGTAKSGIRAALRGGLLRGKDLACWCPLDQPCHADVLLALANQVYCGDDDRPAE